MTDRKAEQTQEGEKRGPRNSDGEGGQLCSEVGGYRQTGAGSALMPDGGNAG